MWVKVWVIHKVLRDNNLRRVDTWRNWSHRKYINNYWIKIAKILTFMENDSEYEKKKHAIIDQIAITLMRACPNSRWSEALKIAKEFTKSWPITTPNEYDQFIKKFQINFADPHGKWRKKFFWVWTSKYILERVAEISSLLWKESTVQLIAEKNNINIC